MDDFYRDDDEAQDDPVEEADFTVGHRVFDSLEEAIGFLQAQQWRRTQRALRALDEHRGIPYRPDTVDGVISPDSRPPAPRVVFSPCYVNNEFERMMNADKLWSFPLEAQTRVLRLYDTD